MYVDPRRMIFITGASRSGTTLLSFMLRRHPDVFGLKELQFFGNAWDPREPERRFSRQEAIEAVAAMLAHQELGVLVHEVPARHRRSAQALVADLQEAAADPAQLFAAVVHRLAEGAGKSIPCEQTPRYIFYARALLERYPAARMVHLVRDPRAVMASQKMRWRRRQLAAESSRVPLYESLRVWVNYHPYTIARLWSRATAAATELREHPRFSLLRFEDLLLQPEHAVRRLCGRLQLDYDPRMLNVGQVNSSHEPTVEGGRKGLRVEAIDKWRDVLTRTEVHIMERACAPLMRTYGYEPLLHGAVPILGMAGYGLSYLAHLGGVLIVNPSRAYVQGKALMHGSHWLIGGGRTRRRTRAGSEALKP